MSNGCRVTRVFPYLGRGWVAEGWKDDVSILHLNVGMLLKILSKYVKRLQSYMSFSIFREGRVEEEWQDDVSILHLNLHMLLKILLKVIERLQSYVRLSYLEGDVGALSWGGGPWGEKVVFEVLHSKGSLL